MFSVCVRVELPVDPTNSNPVALPVASSAPDCTRHVHPCRNRLLLCGLRSTRQSLFDLIILGYLIISFSAVCILSLWTMGWIRIMDFKGRERKQWRGISNVTSWIFSPAANNYEKCQIDMSPAEFSKLGLPGSETVSINTNLRGFSFDDHIKSITGNHLASCLMDITPKIKMAAHLQLEPRCQICFFHDPVHLHNMVFTRRNSS